jgi:glycosidase
MQWDSSWAGGFTTGEPWLPPIDPAERNVEAQRADSGSLLNHYRRLIAARRELGSAFRILDSPPGTLSYERDGHVVTIEAE